MVFDTLGGEVQEESWKVLKPGGILVSVISPPPEDRAKELGVRSAFVFIQPDAEILKEMADLLDKGRIRPVVGAEFSLQDVVKAHRLSQSGHSVGKIALYLGMP